MAEDYVDIQDGQKPVVKGWTIVVNGKRTENIDLMGIMELAITLLKTANGCESGNNRTGLWPQDATVLLEQVAAIKAKIEGAVHVSAPYDHPDVYGERSGI